MVERRTVTGPASRWRELLEQRLEEAVASLGAAPGVRDLVVAGSVGRGEPWPMSDIDLLPIVAAQSDPAADVEQRRARLVDWWAASGRAQTLDVGWLSFTDEEVEQAVRCGPSHAAERMSDRRWFHGLDKPFGGRGARGPSGLAGTFATWATAVRFHPLVVAARVEEWTRQAVEARDRAAAAASRGDRVQATLGMREAARALRLVLVESWGERLGSMGREWTRFDRMAQRHGAVNLAARCADVAGADVTDAVTRARRAPVWLLERIDLVYAARLAVGEEVTAEESARDQVAAFAVHVTRRWPEPWGDWVGVPDPCLPRRLDELERLFAEVCFSRSCHG